MANRKRNHLKLRDRSIIQDGIGNGDSMAGIARDLGVPTSTVTREVKRNRVPESPGFRPAHDNVCSRSRDCERVGLCGTECRARCASCRKGPSTCNSICPDFEPRECALLQKAPFCCNACHKRFGSGRGRPTAFYDARAADELARERASESRRGIDLTPEELAEMDALVTPLVKRGQSPEAIWAEHGVELPVCARTYYNYVAAGAVSCIGLDLPKKVRFKPRKKRRGQLGEGDERGDLTGRLYGDFAALPDADKAASWQMDCVLGRQGDKPALLTLSFPPLCLQLVMLLERKDQAHVRAALDSLEALLGGPEGFERVFPVILTDRGGEFLDPEKIERSAGGERRTSVYYCDPQQSSQKPFCERLCSREHSLPYALGPYMWPNPTLAGTFGQFEHIAGGCEGHPPASVYSD